MSGLLFVVAVLAGAEGGEVPAAEPIWVEMETTDGSTARVELVGYEEGRFQVRTREGLLSTVEEERVVRMKVLRVGGRPPWKKREKERGGEKVEVPAPPVSPAPVVPPGRLTEEERRMLANIRLHLKPSRERVAKLMQARFHGRLDEVKRSLLAELSAERSVPGALERLGDLMVVLHMQHVPPEETVGVVRSAARSIRDEEVRAEVVETLKFMTSRLPEWMRQLVREALAEYIRRMRPEEGPGAPPPGRRPFFNGRRGPRPLRRYDR